MGRKDLGGNERENHDHNILYGKINFQLKMSLLGGRLKTNMTGAPEEEIWEQKYVWRKVK